MNISNEAVIYCEYEARYQISQVISVTLPSQEHLKRFNSLTTPATLHHLTSNTN